jgi:hypothetical protein
MTPNPGSKEAIEQNCKCPVMDNHNGKGFHYGTDEPCFWINAECPLHGEKVEKDVSE